MRGSSRPHGKGGRGARYEAAPYEPGYAPRGYQPGAAPGYDEYDDYDGRDQYGDEWTSATHVDVGRRPVPATATDAGYSMVPRATRRAARPERGLPGWLALVVLLVISAIGGTVDMAQGSGLKGGFNVALVVASAVAILIVRRTGMFPIVIAPPLVYAVGSAFALYLRTGGNHDKAVIIDAASNWLVYGFPAVAGATAIVLIVAGIRLVIRK
jgi:hypothetical protein